MTDCLRHREVRQNEIDNQKEFHSYSMHLLYIPCTWKADMGKDYRIYGSSLYREYIYDIRVCDSYSTGFSNSLLSSEIPIFACIYWTIAVHCYTSNGCDMDFRTFCYAGTYGLS